MKDNSAAAFNTAEGLKTVEFWKSLIDSGVSRHAGWGEFEKGAGGPPRKAPGWSEFGRLIHPSPSTSPRCPFPRRSASDEPPEANRRSSLIIRRTRRRGAAAFLEWFLQDEQVMNWSTTTGMLPVTQSMASSDKYLSWVKENEPRLMPYIEQMKYARTRPNTPLARRSPTPSRRRWRRPSPEK